MYNKYILITFTALSIIACKQKKADPAKADNIITPIAQSVDLPAPYATKAVANYCKLVDWPKGKTPAAPTGFKVSLFADSLDNPRNIYVGPGGEIFVSEANTEVKGAKKFGSKLNGAAASQNLSRSANRITLFKDTNEDGVPDSKSIFLSNLNQPYGMLIMGNYFYVANTDGLWQYPYKAGDTKIIQPGKMILSLPAGGYNNHWTRNIRASADGKKIYVGVGSGTNVADHGMENEKRRADVLEINPDGTGERIYASGLRNPAGLAVQPGTGTLYAAVNERDNLGDDLVPDYLTSVKEGGFYGWPWSYFGKHEDPRLKPKRPDMVAKALTPDFALGSHTASLGLAFYDGKQFPSQYKGGVFIGQHGSWNRAVLSGYKVTFVPFSGNKPSGKMQDFLTGFIADSAKKEVYGRPVAVTIAKDGALLVADDSGNKIWRIIAAKQ